MDQVRFASGILSGDLAFWHPKSSYSSNSYVAIYSQDDLTPKHYGDSIPLSNLPHSSLDFIVADEKIYSVGFSGLRIYDIADPANPQEIVFVEREPTRWGFDLTLAKENDFIFLYEVLYDWESNDATKAGSVLSFDVADPAHPRLVGEVQLPFPEESRNHNEWTRDLQAANGYLYLAAREHGLWTIDVSNPSLLAIIGHRDVYAADVDVLDHLVYLASGSEGMEILQQPDSVSSVRVMPAYSIANSITLDADFGDWMQDDTVHIARNTVLRRLGDVPDPDDLSGEIRSVWTETALYFAIEVQDDAVLTDSTQVWHDDAVEIGIDGRGDSQWWGDDDHQFTITADGRIADGGESTDLIQAVTMQTENGWRTEIRIPAAALDLPVFAPGTSMRLNFGLIDDDDGNEFDSHLIWKGEHTWRVEPEWGELQTSSDFQPTPTATVTPTPTITPTSTPTATPTPIPLWLPAILR